MSLRVRSWLQTNTYAHTEFPPQAPIGTSVSVCLPARDEARTIAPILSELTPLLEAGVIDQLAVLDDSTDGTGELARAAGAEVYDQQQLMPELGPVLGKGDAMWRALPVLRGDIVCFLDADSEQFGRHFPCGLIGPLLRDPGVALVKGFYRRPFRVGDVVLPDGGGRVTELCARPLLNLFYPELAAIRQPLAGEIAARRELLEQLPFVTGYGVDIALLIDAYAIVGLDGIAQVDLDVRQNDHQPLRDLGAMAYAVLQAVCARLEREGRLRGPLPSSFLPFGELPPAAEPSPLVERPPLGELRAAA